MESRAKKPELVVAHVLHMNGGDGETSYANNSFWQEKGISDTERIREEVITSLYSNTLPRSLAIADLGCSSGANTLSVMSQIIKVVEKLCKQMNRSSPEYQLFFNDLPGNDFNNIFKSFDNFKKKLLDEVETEIGRCYFFGAPGSFYGRVFPDSSLHFVHSSFSLQWLSKVPEGIDNNKGAIYINSKSSSTVVKAYYEQFQRDLSVFIKCRAEEIVEGGHMVLMITGRRSDDPCSKESCYLWELLATALNDMVLQGIITEDEVTNFNIPNYFPSSREVRLEFLKEGSFSINQENVFEGDLNSSSYITKSVRAAYESLLVSHFGGDIMEEVFSRYEKILIDRMSKEVIKACYITISLTRKTSDNQGSSCPN